jgi:predicted Zn finger-like uncharacterized protein
MALLDAFNVASPLLTLWGAYTGTHSWVSSIRSGKDIERLAAKLGTLEQATRAISARIEVIGSRSFILPDSKVLTPETVTSHTSSLDSSLLREQAERMTGVLQDSLKISALVSSPSHFQRAIKRHIADVLLDIQPLSKLARPEHGHEHQYVPVLFQDAGSMYVGWQKKAVLETLLNVSIDESRWEETLPTPDVLDIPACRCTACKRKFFITASQLSVSEGWVRCGRCGEVFQALENLLSSDHETLRGPDA